MKYTILFCLILLSLSLKTSKSDPSYENAEEIYNFFISKGWTKNAICGMLGNMHWESDGLQPNINEKGGGGYGLVQWTPKSTLKNWADENGLDYRTVNTQCRRIQYELENKIQYYKAKCNYRNFREFSQSYDTVNKLATCFMREYERPAEQTANLQKRIEYAEYWYKYFNGDKPDPKPTPDKDVVFTYAVKIKNGKILPEVKSNSNDFAGIQGMEIIGIAIKVNKGSVRYCVHIKDGSWLSCVSNYDWNDSRNGYAGNGKSIDLVKIIYSEDNEKPLYRVSPLNKSYYPWQKGSKTGSGYDGYAGQSGKVIDRLQISL